MINTIRYRRALNKLHRRKEQRSIYYTEQISSAIQKKEKQEHINSLRSDRRIEMSLLDDEIEDFVSQRLLEMANRLMLPIPPVNAPDEDGAWQYGEFIGGRYLTRAAMKTLRQDIRQEREADRQAVAFWVSSALGLIGACTGLAAVLGG